MTLTFPTISLSSLIAHWRHAARSHPLSHPEPQSQSFTDADQARADQARADRAFLTDMLGKNP